MYRSIMVFENFIGKQT